MGFAMETAVGPGWIPWGAALAQAVATTAVLRAAAGPLPAWRLGASWRPLLAFGAPLAAAQLAVFAFGYFDNLAIGRWLGPAALAPYALAYALAPQASAAWRVQAPAWLAALGLSPLPVADTSGLVVARTVAMLINEAADAVLQGVCTPEGANAAMKLGVNYPAGPFEWLKSWSRAGVIAVLEALDAQYRGERFRVSPWLRREA
jgi:3-hydroxybutyryl-CoA dehydrogenase